VEMCDEHSTIDELGSKVHNAWDKVRHGELTKPTKLQTKNAESNASP